MHGLYHGGLCFCWVGPPRAGEFGHGENGVCGVQEANEGRAGDGRALVRHVDVLKDVLSAWRIPE